MIRRLLAAIVTLHATAVPAFDNFSATPGGIAGVLVAAPGALAPRAWFGKHPLPVLLDAEGWKAVVGLPRDLAPGSYVVNTADAEDHYESRTFYITPVARPIYRIEVSDDPGLRDLVARHRHALNPPELDVLEGDPPDMDFVLPVDLPIRFQFGLLHLDGSGYTLPFPGLGFDSERPVTMVNPSFGQVVDIERGGDSTRVVVHHGFGLFSVFRNLADVVVSLEDWVAKGDSVGTLPRRDNIRLLPDWGVALNGAWVDPLLLVSQRIELGPPEPPGVAPQ